jgi:dGTPase
MEALVREYVYNYKPVLESEASGFEVMSSLIESFAITSNICFSCGDRETPKQLKLKSLLPKEFRPDNEEQKGNLTFNEKYVRVLKVLDYVSGMTDNYAVSLFRRIKGISLPNS